jgi:hypothetical protein
MNDATTRSDDAPDAKFQAKTTYKSRIDPANLPVQP